jgi:hypothetical protein
MGKCRAKTKYGDRCVHGPVLFGYCLQHYVSKLYKPKSINSKRSLR